MTLFWPYYGIGALPSGSNSNRARRARLRDLEARMESFLVEKENKQEVCTRVLGNVKECKTRLRGELAHLS
jgi:hypothetical protein